MSKTSEALMIVKFIVKYNFSIFYGFMTTLWCVCGSLCIRNKYKSLIFTNYYKFIEILITFTHVLIGAFLCLLCLFTFTFELIGLKKQLDKVHNSPLSFR